MPGTAGHQGRGRSPRAPFACRLFRQRARGRQRSWLPSTTSFTADYARRSAAVASRPGDCRVDLGIAAAGDQPTQGVNCEDAGQVLLRSSEPSGIRKLEMIRYWRSTVTLLGDSTYGPALSPTLSGALFYFGGASNATVDQAARKLGSRTVRGDDYHVG